MAKRGENRVHGGGGGGARGGGGTSYATFFSLNKRSSRWDPVQTYRVETDLPLELNGSKTSNSSIETLRGAAVFCYTLGSFLPSP